MQNLPPFAGINPAVALLLFYLILTIQALALAGLLWLLQFCYKHTPGFTAYYQALQRIYNNSCRRRVVREIVKPLGLCVYCQSVYFAAGVFLIQFKFEVIPLLLFVGLTYLFVEFAGRIIYPPLKK